MNKALLIFITFSLFIIPFNYLKAQDNSQKKDTSDYYKSNYLRYDNHVYVDNIKTVLLYPAGAETGTPTIKLNANGKLMLSFDDLDNDIKNYSYTFIHCEADWTPSDYDKANYITGYTDEPIETNQYSSNTLTKYTHYTLTFPSQTMQPTISGNYVLIVFRDYDQKNIILTRRFMIYEQLVSIDAKINRASVIDDRNAKQKVDFSILYPNYKIDNPFEELKVVITQNDRTDNAITNLKPLFLKDKELDYNYEKENTFNGGNEFRFFDTRNLNYLAEHIYRFAYDSIGNHQTFLDQDQRRSSKRYLTAQDINGSYLIHVQDKTDAGIEADYTTVHFSLPLSEQITDGNIYVFGAFSDWRYGNDTRMKYTPEDNSYHAALLLKQGYYNYEYIFVKTGTDSADHSYIEGSHYETENDYTIYVYHHPIGVRYDKLIGVKRVNSIKG